MAKLHANLQYASLSDPGLKRLANEDAMFCDGHFGLFVVCDGIGGMPSGEAASNIIAHSVRHLIKRKLRRIEKIDRKGVQGVLAEVIKDINYQLTECAKDLPTLTAMGATIVMTLIDGTTAYLAHAGDSRAYLLRKGTVSQLTTDHVRGEQVFVEQAGGDLLDAGERRLLMQFVGRPGSIKPNVGYLTLEEGDRLLLCTDGLTDPVPTDKLAKILREAQTPTQASATLVKAALDGGGPDNVTVAVVDFLGLKRMGPVEKPPKPDIFTAPRGAAQRVHDALMALDEDMAWLLEGAKEARQESALSALAAVKRRIGHELYREFLEHHPTTKNPAHIFHQIATAPGNPWRERYQQHINDLETPLAYITNGEVRLSSLFTPQETAVIFKSLWRDWRRVEARYFATSQRDAHDTSEKTLDILIHHMQGSVRTLIGLLRFLPRYMRVEWERERKPEDPVEAQE